MARDRKEIPKKYRIPKYQMKPWFLQSRGSATIKLKEGVVLASGFDKDRKIIMYLPKIYHDDECEPNCYCKRGKNCQE